MRRIVMGISSRIIIPILLMVFTLAIVLYVFVLRSVTEFAESSISAKLIEMRKDVYDICDLKYSSILFAKEGENEKFIRIQKSHAISAIEDFARNNFVDVTIRQGNRYIYYTSKFPWELKAKENEWSRTPPPRMVLGEYFVSRVIFGPWDWDIIMFKNKSDFAYLHEDVNRIYGITGIIIGVLAAVLFFYMNRIVAQPLRMVTEPLRQGRNPDYKGIPEFEFLSDSIREMMRRLQEETEIRISEEKLRSIIESILVGVAVTTDDGIVLEANTTQARMLGYESREALIGSSVFDHYYDPSERPNVINLARMNMLRGYEFRVKRKDGSMFWASMNIIQQPSPSGMRFICSMVDISLRKLAEEELINSHLQLMRLSRHLTIVREEERRTIARDIHDELGQELTALKMYIATLAGNLPAERPDLRAKTVDMTELVNRTIKVVQRLVNELRPGLLDTLGLRAAIESDITRYENSSNITITAMMSAGDIGQEQAVAMYRVWQEAMTNVMRHADATEVKVSLTESEGNVVMDISDNGVGMDEVLIDNPQSFGIVGMKERIQMVNGTFRITSNGEGTTVHVEVPNA
jgi:PAS domain S-box-containing protein